ncbi:hypothetical protein F5Y11DRAFT_331059 [Daldinia sp. FL1419]|nr:hypothetical protein F5Y11DRAFT_331059 [Daldinia sp. FL1419]
MGLSTTTSDNVSIRSTILEAGSRFTTYTRSRSPDHEDSLLKLDSDQICYGGWDDGNLFGRLAYNDKTSEYTMEEYVNYLRSLIEKLPVVCKPLGRLAGLRSPAYEDEYETEIHASSCPSLTDGSTISRASSLPRSQTNSSHYPPMQRKLLLLSKSDRLLKLKKTSTYTESHGLRRLTFPHLPRANLTYSLNWKSRIERWPNKSNKARHAAVKMPALPTARADIRTPYYEMSDSDSLYSETSTDISSDDEEFDPFENLNSIIRKVFASNKQLADRVIDYLIQLPPDRRARFYGYWDVSFNGAESLQESSIIVGGGGNSRPTKRKRIDEMPPNNLDQNQALGSDDHDGRVLVDRHPSDRLSSHKRFACGYNIFDRATYSPRNTRGRTATRYKSCAGPGFTSLNHYKRHLERVHTLHQCSRCGNVFEKPGELQNHLLQNIRCDSLVFDPEGGMSQDIWDKVKDIFKKRRKTQGEPSDEERWFQAWDVLFPGVERPPTAYFEEPQIHSAYQSRVLEIFRYLVAEQPQLAPARPCADDLMGALTHALNVAGQGAEPDQEVGDPIIISPLEEAPIPSTQVRERAPDINHASYIEPRPTTPANVHLGSFSQVEEPRDHYDGFTDDPDLFAVFSLDYPAVNVTGGGWL